MGDREIAEVLRGFLDDEGGVESDCPFYYKVVLLDCANLCGRIFPNLKRFELGMFSEGEIDVFTNGCPCHNYGPAAIPMAREWIAKILGEVAQ